MDAATEKSGPNPVLWVVFGILTFTVVASAFLIYAATRDADPPRPSHYEREGAGLDADLRRAAAAAELGVRVTLDLGTPGLIGATLRFRDAAHPAPAALVLRLTHATLPALDRTMELRPAVSAPGFTARTVPLPAGHWLVEVAGDDTWRLRGRFTAPAASLMELGR